MGHSEGGVMNFMAMWFCGACMYVCILVESFGSSVERGSSSVVKKLWCSMGCECVALLTTN